MATRRSDRLAARRGGEEHPTSPDEGGSTDEGERREEEKTRDYGRRASVGDTLGLTPAVPKGRNLRVVKAAGLAAEAAANLDALNTPRGKSARKKRKSKKARKGGKL